MKKVLILFGGNSFEHEVSCRSAKCILENIDQELFEITAVCIDKQNNWYLFDNDLELLLTDKRPWYTEKNLINNIIEFLKGFDIVFPVLHGPNGEDGTIQGMLDLFDIKYVGPKILSSAIGMDKEISKIVFNHHNIPIIPYLTVKDKNYNIKKIEKELGYPMIVKPARGGSSIGVNKANNKKELISAIEDALKIDNKIIIEKFIIGRELECSILENKNILVSTVGEIASANELYDYNAKYQNENSKTLIPANLPKKVINDIQKYAKEVFIAIEAKNLSRIDFFYDEKNQQIYLNEINTLPGFTSISMYPKLWEYEKITTKDLITILINNA
mgnify:CR=1 FL=1